MIQIFNDAKSLVQQLVTTSIGPFRWHSKHESHESNHTARKTLIPKSEVKPVNPQSTSQRQQSEVHVALKLNPNLPNKTIQ